MISFNNNDRTNPHFVKNEHIEAKLTIKIETY